jgi:hypothetical protein
LMESVLSCVAFVCSEHQRWESLDCLPLWLVYCPTVQWMLSNTTWPSVTKSCTLCWNHYR